MFRPARPSVLLCGAVALLTAGAGLTPAAAAPPAAVPSAPVAAAQSVASPRATPRVSATEVVVRYRGDADTDARSGLRRSVAARATKHLGSLGVDVLTVPDAAAAVARLSASPDVLYAEPVAYAIKSASPYDPNDAPERTEIGAEGAYASKPLTTGSTQTVAVIDDGIDQSNVDLAGKVQDGGDFSGDNSGTGGVFAYPQADNPHGTAVASVIAAAQNSAGIQGVVPRAKVRSYRVFGVGSSYASSTGIAAAIRAVATDSRNDPSLRVANLSLGFSVDTRVVRDAVADAHAINPSLLLVAAAGNDGERASNLPPLHYGLTPSYPAGYPGVLSVGASGLDSSGKWTQTGFSTKGDADVLAPGLHVETWYPAAECDNANGRTSTAPVVCQISGTSFAAPQVAGIAAQLAAVGVTGIRARTAIKASAEPAEPSSQPAVGNGSGRADATKAVTLATGTAPYAAVFVDNGAVLGSATDSRGYEAVRVDPRVGATPVAPTVSVTSGSVSAGTASTTPDKDPTTGVPAPGTATRRGTLHSPAGDSPDVRAASLAVAASGATAATVRSTPVAYVPAAAGNNGVYAVDRQTYSVRTYDPANSASSRFEMFSIGAYVQQGATFTVTMTYPKAPESYAYLDIPSTSGGTAGALSERYASLGDDNDDSTPNDMCVAQLPRTAGAHSCTITASISGRFEVTLFNAGDAGLYSISLDYATPSATVASPALVSSVRTSPSVPVTWKSSSAGVTFDVDRLSRYQTAATSNTWKRYRNGTTATSATIPSGAGSSELFRVRTVSPNGNRSAWSTVSRSVSPYDENAKYFVSYSSGWTAANRSNRWGPQIRYTNTAGASVSFKTRGYRYSVVGDRCGGCGKAQVYVDGVLKATIDTYSSTDKVRQVLWTSPVLSGGSGVTHTVKVRNLRTSGRPSLRLDGLASYR